MGAQAVAIRGAGVQPSPSVLQIGLGLLLRIWKSGHLEFLDLVLMLESNLVSERIRNIVPPTKIHSVLYPTELMQLSRTGMVYIWVQ